MLKSQVAIVARLLYIFSAFAGLGSQVLQ